eukprot:5696720-Lingulodinium_polyedra.AAC.1
MKYAIPGKRPDLTRMFSSELSHVGIWQTIRQAGCEGLTTSERECSGPLMHWKAALAGWTHRPGAAWQVRSSG